MRGSCTTWRARAAIAEAMKLQFRVLEIFDMMLNPFEFPDGFRAAAEMRGFALGHGRQPMTPTQQAERAALAEVLRCILADFGVVEPPLAGCAPRTGPQAPTRRRRSCRK